MKELKNKRVNNQKFTTVFYRYNRYAVVIIILYVLGFGVFFYYSMNLPPWVTVAGFLLLILPPLYGAIRKKSAFSLRTWDHRKLILTPEHISIGDQQYPVTDLKIAIFIYGFEGFSYSRNNKWITRNSIYGDRNYLSFRRDKTVDDYQFYLHDYKAYLALYEVVEAWKKNGVSLVVKEQFPQQFVRDQVHRFAGKKQTDEK
jgi:hypothetical protein